MKKQIIALAASALLTSSAMAHFLVTYTPNMALSRAQDVDMSVVFTHPSSGGPSMQMEPVRGFYAVSKRGDESIMTDLSDYLAPVTWTDPDGNQVAAFDVTIPRSAMRSIGDYHLVMEPTPYYEAEEEIYIQQITKVIMNVGGAPTNWDETLGLPAEIQVLNRPYANWTNGLFTGVVLSEGKPVPNAEIEIEYLNYDVDQEMHKFGDVPAIRAPHPALEYISLRSDANGQFSLTLPKAGWWGVAALGVGPQTEYKGEPLSQDAVLWIQAVDMP